MRLRKHTSRRHALDWIALGRPRRSGIASCASLGMLEVCSFPSRRRHEAGPVFFREARLSRSDIGVVGGASRILRLKPPFESFGGGGMVTTCRKLSPVTFDSSNNTTGELASGGSSQTRRPLSPRTHLRGHTNPTDWPPPPSFSPSGAMSHRIITRRQGGLPETASPLRRPAQDSAFWLRGFAAFN